MLPAALAALPRVASRALPLVLPACLPAHPTHTTPSRLVNVIALERGVDTLTWQLIASVAAPGFTVHTVVALAAALLRSAEVRLAGFYQGGWGERQGFDLLCPAEVRRVRERQGLGRCDRV